MTPMDADALIDEDEAMPALQSADHGNLGRWVQRVVQSSEKRLHDTVEQLRAAVRTLASEVDHLAGRNETNERVMSDLSDKIDGVNQQLHQVIGKLSVLVPDKDTKPDVKQAGMLNERTIPLFGMVILTGMLVFVIYALVFGDEALERKLDRIPGVQVE